MLNKILTVVLAISITAGTALAEEVTLGYTEVDAKAATSTASPKGKQYVKTNTTTPDPVIDGINKPSDPQAINGGLNRDIIRRIQSPKPPPKPKPNN